MCNKNLVQISNDQTLALGKLLVRKEENIDGSTLNFLFSHNL